MTGTVLHKSATVVIAGAGLAGGRAAEALRSSGFEGRVVLVGAEPERPYERPPLSKERLRGSMARDDVFLRPPDYYAEQRIELRLGSALSTVDVSNKCAALDSGELLRYDKLLVATGAEVRRLQVPGSGLAGVCYLRTLRDCDQLGELLAAKPRVLIVGAGFIGCEVAASARSLGCEVTLLDVATPLARALGEDVGRLFARLHREQGVDVRAPESVTSFDGAGRLESAVLSRGEVLACDLAVIGIGVRPATGALAGCGIELSDGIVVDEFCRTSAADVYAAGDVANWWHPRLGERLRVEHFDNAQHQGVAAAKSMLGAGEPYAPVPFFWSDQYDLTLQYAGHAPSWDDIVMRGDFATRSFSALYLRGGRLVACAAVNRFKDFSAARRLIEAGTPVAADRLRDESVELKSL